MRSEALTIAIGMYGLACNKWTVYKTALDNTHLHTTHNLF